MRRCCSPPSLQLLAAAATDNPSMSSRPIYRGGSNRGRRGYCGRTIGGEEQFVTGESHFQSVREANRGCRRGERSNFGASSSWFQRQPSNPRQAFNKRPHFNPTPAYDRNQPYHQRPQFNPNRPFPRPQIFWPTSPKPSDYRNWEYAKSEPPADSERFKILSYNILADYLAISHRSKLYSHIPVDILDWEWRKGKIIFELGLWSADVMCFQEVDRFQDLEELLKLQGYSGIWKIRTGDAIDGCAIFWRASRFKLLYEEGIEFNKLGLRDNVAQICVLESMSPKGTKNTSLHSATSSSGSNKVVICNIHVLYNPKRGEIKLGQVRVLLNRAHAVSKIWDGAPVVLCGDFNCTPKSPLYNFISEQKINLIGLDRNKVSGQASSEIHQPRPYSRNPRAQSTDNSIQATATIDGREVGMKQGNSIFNMQMQNSYDSSVRNAPVMNSLSQPICDKPVLGMPDNSCWDGHCANKNGTLANEVTQESQPDTIDACRNQRDSIICVPVGRLNESQSLNDDGSLTDIVIDGNHNEIKTQAASCYDCADLIETGYGEEVDVTSTSILGSFSQECPSNMLAQNETMKCDKATLLYLGDDYSTEAKATKPVNTSNSDSSLSQLHCQCSFSSVIEASCSGSTGNLSMSIANDKKCEQSASCLSSSTSTSIDLALEGNQKLSQCHIDEATKEDGSLGEERNTFLSELHVAGDQSDVVKLDHSEKCDTNTYSLQLQLPGEEIQGDFSPGIGSVPVEAEKTTYDPSQWTPMEMETATGNADCTLVEHPLKLRSAYVEAEDCSGARDSNGEPMATSYNRCFLGTVDYIWHSEGLQTVRVLAPIPTHVLQWTRGFPTRKWGSDHIALASELAFTKGVTSPDAEVQ
ncbi:carbon catabolite repressor protein 4 homolog 6 [Malania oleifera]|uniref:carbon catabolite repressor protein 4 homolog 6 n=1 Tax=Malania oleifera TaxID=397392 RepID=UPI0025AE427B|nr:carbon catabolite repressor protein 4 homolog 6 [Malania oleifera]